MADQTQFHFVSLCVAPRPDLSSLRDQIMRLKENLSIKLDLSSRVDVTAGSNVPATT